MKSDSGPVACRIVLRSGETFRWEYLTLCQIEARTPTFSLYRIWKTETSLLASGLMSDWAIGAASP
jgi:hypothetical protein